MFLSSEDVSDKYTVSKTIQNTAIECELSLKVYTNCFYNKAPFSKQVVKNVIILKRKHNINNCCTPLMKCQYI